MTMNDLQISTKINDKGNSMEVHDGIESQIRISTPAPTIPTLDQHEHIMVPSSHSVDALPVKLGNNIQRDHFTKDDSTIFHKEVPQFITQHAALDIDIQPKAYNDMLSL